MQERQAKIRKRMFPLGPYKCWVDFKHLMFPEPESWEDHRRIFVNEFSDTFISKMWYDQKTPANPEYVTELAFAIYKRLPHHDWLNLTKRPENAKLFLETHNAPSNFWLGTSIGIKKGLHRIDVLRECDVKIRYLSLEALLEDLGKLDLTGIHWVIVGGESCTKGQLKMSQIARATNAPRPMNLEWVRSIRDQCIDQNVPFFLKQLGGYKAGNSLEELPEDLRIREYPK